jgi:hypothetical protein
LSDRGAEIGSTRRPWSASAGGVASTPKTIATAISANNEYALAA